jgi:hypothetical protein
MVIDAAALFRTNPVDRLLISHIAAKLAELERANIHPTHLVVHSGRFGGIAGSRLFGLEVIFSGTIQYEAAYLMVRV